MLVARLVGVAEQRAGGQQPVGQRLDGAAALAAELEAPQCPGQLAGARRAARDEPAERAQRVLLFGAEQTVALGAADAGGERDRHPRAAVGARPGGRPERGLGVVPQAERGLQPSQAAAGVLECVAVAPLGLEREHGDGRVRVLGQAGREAIERRRADEAEPVAERDLVGLDHEALDGREDDAQRVAGVRGLLQLLVGGFEALGVEHEVGHLGPHGAEEGLERGLGVLARIGAARAAAAELQVAGQVRQCGQAVDGRAEARQPSEHARALREEAAGQRPVAVQRSRAGRRGVQLERDLGAARDLFGELPGSLLDEGRE